MNIQIARQDLLDMFENAPYGSVVLTLNTPPDTQYTVVRNLKIANKMLRMNAIENSLNSVLDDANNLAVFDVNAVRWLSIPISTIATAEWSGPPVGIFPWETIDERISISYGGIRPSE
jgi:UDP:flavonoid glycosyltransferase YjiC (YdhE family)